MQKMPLLIFFILFSLEGLRAESDILPSWISPEELAYEFKVRQTTEDAAAALGNPGSGIHFDNVAVKQFYKNIWGTPVVEFITYEKGKRTDLKCIIDIDKNNPKKLAVVQCQSWDNVSKSWTKKRPYFPSEKLNDGAGVVVEEKDVLIHRKAAAYEKKYQDEAITKCQKAGGKYENFQCKCINGQVINPREKDCFTSDKPTNTNH